MWKLSFIVFSFITIGDSSARPGTTRISSDFRNYGNERHRSEARSVRYSEEEIDRRDAKDYSDEFEGEELIGRWRNSGGALEPKWRDGDSLPLVPFDDSPEQRNHKSRDATSKLYESSLIFEEFIEPEEQLSKIRVVDERTVDKIRIPLEYESSSRSDDFSTKKMGFREGEKAARIPATRLTSSTLNEPNEKSLNSGEPRTKNIELNVNNNVKSRQGETFGAELAEYEINDEEYRKPRPRKRRPPQSDEFVETRPPTYSVTWSTEKYMEDVGNTRKALAATARRPEVAARRDDENRKASESSSFDARRNTEKAELRSLLKMQQIEGLSLSELLQRRNFTLNDLLVGKAEVLDVLKSNESAESAETFGVRSKIFEARKFHRSRLDESRNSSINEITKARKSESDAIGEFRARLVENEDSMEKIVSSSSEENEKLSAIVRLTKPIILPSGNETRAARAGENFEKKILSTANEEDDDEIMQFSDFTVKKTPTEASMREETTDRGRAVEVDDDSGSTLSIENLLSGSQRILPISETNVRHESTSNRDNSTDDAVRVVDFDYQSDEPRESAVEDKADDEIVEMKEDSNSGEKRGKNEKENASDSPRNHSRLYSSGGKPYELVISEIEPEARAEIFELLSTGSSAKRLEGLLKSRNMSIDELIELRKRGSSKVHLAEISRPREAGHRGSDGEKMTRERSRGEETRTEASIPEVTSDDLSDIEIDSSSSERSEETTSEGRPSVSFIEKATIAHSDDKNRRLLELLRSFDSLPFSVAPDEAITEKSMIREEARPKVGLEVVGVVGGPKDPSSLVEIGLVEEIVEEESVTIEDLTETNIRGNYSSIGKPGNKRNLSKVRPSIIASGAILGVTIVVFLAIFVVCRIKQKQKYTYRNNFSRAVFQGPAATARKLSNSSSVNTIMVNVVATSTADRPDRRDNRETDENYESKSDIENDSLDANDSWETIPDFMK